MRAHGRPFSDKLLGAREKDNRRTRTRSQRELRIAVSSRYDQSITHVPQEERHEEAQQPDHRRGRTACGRCRRRGDNGSLYVPLGKGTG